MSRWPWIAHKWSILQYPTLKRTGKEFIIIVSINDCYSSTYLLKNHKCRLLRFKNRKYGSRFYSSVWPALPFVNLRPVRPVSIDANSRSRTPDRQTWRPYSLYGCQTKAQLNGLVWIFIWLCTCYGCSGTECTGYVDFNKYIGGTGRARSPSPMLSNISIWMRC